MLHRVVGLSHEIKYQDHADKISLLTKCIDKVIGGELLEPVLSLEPDNGFKIPPNRLYDRCSRKYASLIEWSNPQFRYCN